jgi:hypothetical protein
LPEKIIPMQDLTEVIRELDNSGKLDAVIGVDTNIGDIRDILEDALHVATVTEEHVDQWDSNFLKASGTYDGYFDVIGPHPDHEFVRQGYEQGEYEEGLVDDDESPEYIQVSESERKFLDPTLYLDL